MVARLKNIRRDRLHVDVDVIPVPDDVQPGVRQLSLPESNPMQLEVEIADVLASQEDVKAFFSCVMNCLALTYRENGSLVSFHFDSRYPSLGLARETATRAEGVFRSENPRSNLLMKILEHESDGDVARVEEVDADRKSSSLETGVHNRGEQDLHDVPPDMRPLAPNTSVATEPEDVDAPMEKERPIASTPAIHGDSDVAPESGQWRKGNSDQSVILREKRYILGEPAGSYSQIPYLAKQTGKNQFRADLAADISQVGQLLVLAASFRGAMHYASSVVRQDSFAVGAATGKDGSEWVIAAVADGVSEASQSHLLADFLSQQTVGLMKEQIERDTTVELSVFDWMAISKDLVTRSAEFCERLAQGKLSPRHYASRWASTLEFVVVRADLSRSAPFVAISVAGDGATYLIHPSKGWKTVKSGKSRSGSLASNAVAALPQDPGEPIVAYGQLEPGELILLSTDGLSDMIGDGATALGSFFQTELPGCTNLISFLQVTDISMFQGDDDRTAITIQVCAP